MSTFEIRTELVMIAYQGLLALVSDPAGDTKQRRNLFDECHAVLQLIESLNRRPGNENYYWLKNNSAANRMHASASHYLDLLRTQYEAQK